MSKKCTPLWRQANFQVKMYKTHQVGTTFGSWDDEKVHAVVAGNTFRSQNVKTPHAETTFWRSDVVSRGRRKGLWVKRSISKNDGRRGTFEEDLQRFIFRGRRSARDMFIRAVRRSGRWFPERGCILEHQIFRFAEMILRDRRSTSYDLASLFRGRRNTLDRWSGKIAKHIGTRPSTLHSTIHVWRKSRRVASLLVLSTSKNEEVSQNCFVFDVDKVQTLRKARRIAAFLMLSCSKTEEVSRNSFVFNLADRQMIERQLQLQLQLQIPLHYTTTTTSTSSTAQGGGGSFRIGNL